MATLTSAWADHIYNLVNLGTAPPAVTGVYLRLFTDDPTAAGSFADEVAGGSYTGQDITGAMSAPTDGAGTSTGDVTFAAMPAVLVSHWAKCQSAAGTGTDEMIEFGALSVPITVGAGAPLTVTTGDLDSTVT